MPATQCLQALNNGQRCQAPAVNGTLFCRHHDPQPEIEEERRLELRRTQPFSLPEFHDKAGIFVAISAVLHGVSDRKIKRSEAETYLLGLKFASRILTEMQQAGTSPFPALPEEPFFAEVTGPPGVQAIRASQTPSAQNEENPFPDRRPSDRALARLAASRGLEFIPGKHTAEDLLEQLRAQSLETSRRSKLQAES